MSMALLDKEFETDKPYISVIITAYKRKEFILGAVNSVINQSLEKSKYEIIVVKNYLDNTIDKFLNEHNIIDIYTDRIPLGAKIAYGIEKSEGEVICFLEDDDLFLPNKLEIIYSVFKENPNITFLRNEVIKTRSMNLENDVILKGKIGECLITFSVYQLIKLKNVNDLIVKFEANVNISSMSIRKNKYLQYEYLIEKTEFLQDTLIFVISLFDYNDNISFFNEPLSIWRIHRSASNTGENPSIDEILNKHLQNAEYSYNSINIVIEYLKENQSLKIEKSVAVYLNIAKGAYMAGIKLIKGQRPTVCEIKSLFKTGYYHKDISIISSSLLGFISIISPNISRKIFIYALRLYN